MVIAGPVEPGFGALPSHIDHQGIALPTPARPAHPGWGGSFLFPIHADDPGGARKLIGHEDIRTRSLDDLKGKWHVGGAWNAGHVTLQFRIAHGVPLLVLADISERALFEVLFLPGERLRLIGNFAAFNDALPRRTGGICTVDFRMRSGLCVVVLQIPICRNKSLPDSVQVRMAVCHARWPVRGKLTARRRLLANGGR